MALIVWRLTPTASASCCCVMRTIARSTLMLFVIVGMSKAVQFKLKLDDEQHEDAEHINPNESEECEAIQEHGCDKQQNGVGF